MPIATTRVAKVERGGKGEEKPKKRRETMNKKEKIVTPPKRR